MREKGRTQSWVGLGFDGLKQACLLSCLLVFFWSFSSTMKPIRYALPLFRFTKMKKNHTHLPLLQRQPLSRQSVSQSARHLATAPFAPSISSHSHSKMNFPRCSLLFSGVVGRRHHSSETATTDGGELWLQGMKRAFFLLFSCWGLGRGCEEERKRLG